MVMDRNSKGAAPGGLSREAGESGQMIASFFDGPEGSLLWKGRAVLSLGLALSREWFFPPRFLPAFIVVSLMTA